MKPFWVWPAFVGLFLLLFSQLRVSASTVTNCDEASLRAAVTAGGTIQIACDGTIILSQTLAVTRDSTIDAGGRSVVLSGAAFRRVLHVYPGVSLRIVNLTIWNGRSTQGAGLYNDQGFVTLENCTLRANQAVGSQAMGGAIYNAGTLTLIGCQLIENTARGLPGVDGVAGTLGYASVDQFGVCRPSVFSGNGGPGGTGGHAFGGAIFNAFNCGASAISCTIETNVAEGGAGGAGGPAGTMSGCRSNTTAMASGGMPGVGGSAQGGGIYDLGLLTVTASTLAGNTARGGDGGKGGRADTYPTRGGLGGYAAGGALWTAGDSYVTNSTIAENQAAGGRGGPGADSQNCSSPSLNGSGGKAESGGIFNGANLFIHSTTIWNNLAIGGSGTNANNACPTSAGEVGVTVAASLTTSDGSTRLLNSIVGNLNSTQNCAGSVVDIGYNICSDYSADFTATSSRNATDPMVAGLANHGGPTRTIALVSGSPAIDTGDPGSCLPTDQRGVSRPVGSACDIGAYEGQGFYPPIGILAFSPPIVNGGGVVRFTLIFSNANMVDLPGYRFTNELPAGVVIADVPNLGLGCVHQITALPGSSKITGQSFGHAAGRACTAAAVDVRAVRRGVWSNNVLTTSSAKTGFMIVRGNAPITVLGAEVQTIGASQVTPLSARLNGAIDPHADEATYYFEYGPTTAYGTQTTVQTLFGEGMRDVYADVTGLASNKIYHFRLAGRTTTATNYGADVSLFIPSGEVSVQTGGASSVQYDAATLTGKVTPNGWPTTAYFLYGNGLYYENVTPTFYVGDGTTEVDVSVRVGALEDGALYHFILVARNDRGIRSGAGHTFVTPDVSPRCSTMYATLTNGTSWLLYGSVLANGLDTRHWFEIGTTTNLGGRTGERVAPGSGNASTQTVTALLPLETGGTFYFRIVASNPAGTTYGAILSFQSDDPPGGAVDCSSSGSAYSSTVTNAGPSTLSLWFKASGTYDVGLLALYNDEDLTYGRTLFLNSAGQLCFSDHAYNQTVLACSSSVLNDNTWHHAAVTYSSAGVRLFADGFLVGSNGSISGLPSKSGRWFHGAPPPPISRPLYFDEVRIWNFARTEQELRSDMFRLISGQTPGLVACWRFDDPVTSWPWVIQDGTGGPNSMSAYANRVFSTAPLYDGRWIFRLPEGWIKLRLPVDPGATWVLSASSDLKTWTPLVTNSGPGLIEYTDRQARTMQSRFFRVR